MSDADRRPIASRQTGWARSLSLRLVAAHVSPNAISATSMLGALIAGAAFAALAWPHEAMIRSLLCLLAIAGMQFRLVCNLLDGMVALAGGRTPSRTGELWNDLPDRVSDTLILIGAGVALSQHPWGRDLGYLAALLAAMTAYVRQLGRAQGTPACFAGPMAKQHRMAVMTCAAAAEAISVHWACVGWPIAAGLAIVCLGSTVTCLRRLRLVSKALRGTS